MLLWLYLHFPTLQLDTLFHNKDSNHDADVAVAIVDGRRHEVIQANQYALEQGVKLGMGLGSAAALCRIFKYTHTTQKWKPIG